MLLPQVFCQLNEVETAVMMELGSKPGTISSLTSGGKIPHFLSMATYLQANSGTLLPSLSFFLTSFFLLQYC